MCDHKKKDCIFCDIEKDDKTNILYKDEKVIVFPDIRPAAMHHYLAIPTKHIDHNGQLNSSHVDLVKALVEAGLSVLETKNGVKEDVRLGFHRSPFHTVGHLHLHIISPVSQLGYVSRLIFRENSYWFTTADSLLAEIEKKPPPE